ncbi:MAG: serine/threonine protein kinase, partial [Candidatus Aenigmatarchaeota archaeon]
IDFGLSSFSEDIEDKAVDFLLMKKSIKKDEFEEFFKGYKSYGLWEKVIERAKEIERRGRYFERKKE